MLFGLANAPATFQRLMTVLLQVLLLKVLGFGRRYSVNQRQQRSRTGSTKIFRSFETKKFEAESLEV